MSREETPAPETPPPSPEPVGMAMAGMQMEELMLLKQQHDELTAKVVEYEDLLKRSKAEFENYRRRTLKEREDLLRFGGSDVLKDLLPVVDNFDRAAELRPNAETGGDDGKNTQSFVDGVLLIRTQFQDLLKKYGVVEIEGSGSAFDPELHMAIAQTENPEAAPDSVAEVFQKGYRHHDKVLRVATVRVNKGSSPAAS